MITTRDVSKRRGGRENCKRMRTGEGLTRYWPHTSHTNTHIYIHRKLHSFLLYLVHHPNKSSPQLQNCFSEFLTILELIIPIQHVNKAFPTRMWITQYSSGKGSLTLSSPGWSILQNLQNVMKLWKHFTIGRSHWVNSFCWFKQENTDTHTHTKLMNSNASGSQA